MSTQSLSNEEITSRGLSIYENDLKAKLEPQFNGSQVAISVEDGDFEVAPTAFEADRKLRARHPDAVLLLLEVGRPVADWPWSRVDAPAGKA